MRRYINYPLFAIICAVVGFVGCGSDEAGYQEYGKDDAAKAQAQSDAHAHSHTAPHGGHLVELGNHQYNAEVVFDAAGRKLTVYLLDAHAENAHAIAETELELHLEGADGETELTLMAVPQSSDAAGKSSRFELAGEKIPATLKSAEDLHGHVHATIDGKSFAGEISHDHDHGHDHAKGHDEHADHDKDAGHKDKAAHDSEHDKDSDNHKEDGKVKDADQDKNADKDADKDASPAE